MPISEAGNATQLARQRGADPTTVGTRILHELEQHGACTIEALTAILPSCSWNQVFMAVDTLSREGALRLQLHARSQYVVSLAGPRTDTYRPVISAHSIETAAPHPGA